MILFLQSIARNQDNTQGFKTLVSRILFRCLGGAAVCDCGAPRAFFLCQQNLEYQSILLVCSNTLGNTAQMHGTICTLLSTYGLMARFKLSWDCTILLLLAHLVQ